MRRRQAVVFDLDKTIGFFTQIAVVMEEVEDVLGREMKLQEFFDNFPHLNKSLYVLLCVVRFGSYISFPTFHAGITLSNNL